LPTGYFGYFLDKINTLDYYKVNKYAHLERRSVMKIIFEGVEYEWAFGSKKIYDSWMLVNPKEKIFLKGDEISRMVEIRLIKEIENNVKNKKIPMQI